MPVSNSYRYALALTSQFYFCGIPFRLDTTPKCSLNCSYCFAMSRGGRRTSTLLLADPEKIKRKLFRLFEEDTKKTDVVDDFILSKMPIHFGGMSDPFSSELVYKNSLKILEILNEINHPVVISTKKTDVFSDNKLVSLLSSYRNLTIQISISVLDSKISKIIEPNIPSPMARVKTIKNLSNQGFHMIARVQPLFPNYLDNVSNELIPSLGESGVKHVILEFLKLPVEMNLGRSKELFNDLNWDGINYYREMKAEKNGREWMLPTIKKWDLLQPLINQIQKYGMTYGAGDYGLNHLGDTDCCCGLDRINGFENWNKNNISYLIRNNRTNVIILNEDIKCNLSNKSIKMYINSNSRINGENTIFGYIKNKWNRPGTTNAPDTFLGIEWKGEFDEKGNCVYYKSM